MTPLLLRLDRDALEAPASVARDVEHRDAEPGRAARAFGDRPGALPHSGLDEAKANGRPVVGRDAQARHVRDDLDATPAVERAIAVGETLARDVAMHVAAMNPEFVKPADVPEDLVAKEREIFAEQVKAEGKPPEIAARMLEGKLRKRLNEISLVGQPFVKDDKMTVEALLKKAQAEVVSMVRFEVGAGLEKKQGDFAAEVMATVQASAKH